MSNGRSCTDGARSADLSVVVPLYNHERYIAAALESVLEQTLLPKEIVCIDDGSKDGSAEIAQAYAARCDRLKFWSRPNRGAAQTLNEAIRASTGSLVAVLNSDDRYAPTRLARAVVVFHADPRVSAVASDLVCIDHDGLEIEDHWQRESLDFFRRTGDLGVAIVNGNFLRTTSNLVVRRSVFEELGGFDDLRYAHDLHFVLRLVTAGKRLVFLKEKLLWYRLHAANTIAESHHRVRAEWAVVSALYARDLIRETDEQSENRMRLLVQVLKRHDLFRAVETVLLALQRSTDTQFGPSAILRDEALRSQVAAAVELRA